MIHLTPGVWDEVVVWKLWKWRDGWGERQSCEFEKSLCSQSKFFVWVPFPSPNPYGHVPISGHENKLKHGQSSSSYKTKLTRQYVLGVPRFPFSTTSLAPSFTLIWPFQILPFLPHSLFIFVRLIKKWNNNKTNTISSYPYPMTKSKLQVVASWQRRKRN